MKHSDNEVNVNIGKYIVYFVRRILKEDGWMYQHKSWDIEIKIMNEENGINDLLLMIMLMLMYAQQYQSYLSN